MDLERRFEHLREQSTEDFRSVMLGMAQLRDVTVDLGTGLAQTQEGLAGTQEGLAKTQQGLAEVQRGLAETQRSLAQTQQALADTQESVRRRNELFDETLAHMQRHYDRKLEMIEVLRESAKQTPTREEFNSLAQRVEALENRLDAA